MNENVDAPTFQTARGRSCIDLTVCNSQLLRYLTEWRCGEEERYSDHNTITFKLENENQNNVVTHRRTRYIVKEESYGKFKDSLITKVLPKFNCTNISAELKYSYNTQ